MPELSFAFFELILGEVADALEYVGVQVEI